MHAARVAAKIERELGFDVEMVHGKYGEYKVIVDGHIVVDGGSKVIVGILPSSQKIIEAVKARLPV